MLSIAPAAAPRSAPIACTGSLIGTWSSHCQQDQPPQTPACVHTGARAQGTLRPWAQPSPPLLPLHLLAGTPHLPALWGGRRWLPHRPSCHICEGSIRVRIRVRIRARVRDDARVWMAASSPALPHLQGTGTEQQARWLGRLGELGVGWCSWGGALEAADLGGEQVSTRPRPQQKCAQVAGPQPRRLLQQQLQRQHRSSAATAPQRAGRSPAGRWRLLFPFLPRSSTTKELAAAPLVGGVSSFLSFPAAPRQTGHSSAESCSRTLRDSPSHAASHLRATRQPPMHAASRLQAMQQPQPRSLPPAGNATAPARQPPTCGRRASP